MLRRCSICGGPVHARRYCAHHYWRWHNTGDAQTPVCAKQALAKRAELLFESQCIAANLSAVRPETYHSPFDIIVDGWAIDVKASRPNPSEAVPTWQFRLHVHGKRSAVVDAYVLLLTEIPWCSDLWLFVPATNVRSKSLSVTLQSLLHDERQRSWVDGYLDFLAGRYGRKAVAA